MLTLTITRTARSNPMAPLFQPMRTVVDESGKRYILIHQSGDVCRVRDPSTGQERSIDTANLDPISEESPLVTAAHTVPGPVRRILSAVQHDRAIGLLVEIDARSPVTVRSLTAYELCESDLHGLLGEFQAAGLVTEVSVDGERGYRTTEEASAGLRHLRGT